ncbi:MAG TPA: alkaline phosphatase family protein [Anaerolineales bacterium]|nr:alkaline phosphatase family protein [Anaerolineales bacterium]
MTRLLLFLLLDAFRPDYLSFTPRLRQLAAQGFSGSLIEPFGFAPRGAYFGGLNPNDIGYSHQFWRDPARSPFTIARHLHVEGQPDLEPDARQFIDAIARRQVGHYAATFATCAEIPFNQLDLFDIPERLAPWDRQVGYPSLFHQIEDAGFDWFQCAWPESNRLTRHSDVDVIGHTIQSLKSSHRFAYVQLSELDSLGHQYGPGSVQVRDACHRTDVLIAALLEHCYSQFQAVDVVAFGDHGMLSVFKTLDLETRLRALPWKQGRDYTYFLDSTMARFWYHSAAARRDVLATLSATTEGHVLSEDEKRAYHIEYCDPRNGDTYYLANPGVLLFPNFFQHQAPVKGMHGYDPELPDNQGVLIINSQSRCVPVRSGQLRGSDLFALCRWLLDFDPNGSAVLTASKPAVAGSQGRFTLTPDRRVAATIESHLTLITQEILKAAPDTKAIILTGGFGRGEGGYEVSDTGGIRPHNDYDIVFVSSTADTGNLKQLGESLAQQIGIDYVDIGLFRPDDLVYPHPSMLRFDLRFGSQIIWGDPTALSKIPDYAADELPLEEGLKLLFNRCAGLLLGITGEALTQPMTPRAQRFLTNQIVKALLAIADWHLLLWKTYATSYTIKRRRFREYALVAGVPAVVRDQVDTAFAEKLGQSTEWVDDPLSVTFASLGWFVETICQALIREPLQASKRSPTEVLAALTTWKNSDDDSLPAKHLRATMALALASFDTKGKIVPNMLDEAAGWAAILPVPPPDHNGISGTGIAEYERLRIALTRLWEAQCH